VLTPIITHSNDHYMHCKMPHVSHYKGIHNLEGRTLVSRKNTSVMGIELKLAS